MKTLENVKTSGGGKAGKQREAGARSRAESACPGCSKPWVLPYPEPEGRRSKWGEKDRLREDEKTKTKPGTFVLPDLDQFI